jgi:branched-chain amino acid transport system substrate-binding protein
MHTPPVSLRRLLAAALLSLCLPLAVAAPADSAEPIVLGMSAPMSGPNGAYGTQMRQGIETYFAKVNAAGGVNGRPLSLVAMDDGYEVDRAVANAKDLIGKSRAFALMGFYGSASTTAVLPVLDANNIPLIGTISGSDALRESSVRNLFHLRASYGDETRAIVKNLLSVGINRIAVLYQDDAFGQAGLGGVRAALAQEKLEPIATASVPRNTTTLTAAVAEISKAKPQAVILVTLAQASAEFVKLMKGSPGHIYYAALSPVGSDQLIAALGKEMSRGVQVAQVIPYPWSPKLAIVREYKQTMQRFKGEAELSYYGLEGYMNAKLLVAAMERAGPNATRAALVEALHGGAFDLGGYVVNFAPGKNAGSHYVEISVIGPDGRILN